MICQKCNREFKAKCVIEGVHKNLGKRRLCLECMPFRSRWVNTNAWRNTRPEKDANHCLDCGRPVLRRKRCMSCFVHKTRRKKMERLIREVLGGHCILCGYGDEFRWRALEMHHVESKSFCINEGTMGFGWQKIFDEARKCVLVCCRCHKEIHLSLIPEDEVKQAQVKQWSGSKISGEVAQLVQQRFAKPPFG